jgi:hypothetical protein
VNVVESVGFGVYAPQSTVVPLLVDITLTVLNISVAVTGSVCPEPIVLR